MAVFDYRSSVKWEYLPLAVEQLHIVQGANILKFDYILKGGIYDFTPIIRARSPFATVQKKVGYRVGISFDILFTDIETYVTTLESYFVNKQVQLTIYISTTNTSGMNEWRKMVISNTLNVNYAVSKLELQPVLKLNFTGVLKTSQIINVFQNWTTTQPA